MLAEAKYPDILKREELDNYLEKGWFRMGQSIFTTNFLNFKNHLYSAIWLRITLDQMYMDARQQKLQKLNARFSIRIQTASITPEKEILFATYKQGISFTASPSLHTLMYGKASYNIYTTYEVAVYDRDKLIAVGFFDLGKHSAMGITSFYDPSYKKYSLGRYLIFLKIDYCKKLGLKYFYPGYFVPGYTIFDYKLEIGKSALEYLQLGTQRWLSIQTFSLSHSPLYSMRSKLQELQKLLQQKNILVRLINYEFFDANLIPELCGVGVFDFPVFLFFSEMIDSILFPVIIYDVRDQRYHLVKCRSLGKLTAPNTDEFYSSHLLKMEEGILATETAQQIVDWLCLGQCEKLITGSK